MKKTFTVSRPAYEAAIPPSPMAIVQARLILWPAWFVFLLMVLSPLERASGSPLQGQVEQVEFRITPLEDAIEYLRVRSVELDPSGKGMNFIIDPAVDRSTGISLLLNQVSVGVAMICVVEQAELDYRIDARACVILPKRSGELGKNELQSQGAGASSQQATMARQLILNRFAFEEAPLEDVLEFIAAKSREGREDGGGINLIVNHRVDPELPVTLELTNVAVASILREVSDLTGVEIRVEPYAIVIEPPGTRLHREARVENAKAKGDARGIAATGKRPSSRSPVQSGATLGSITKDPRSPVHPDYVKSTHPDVSKRTNSLNNVYKWVNGKWTFVRSGAKAAPDGDGEKLSPLDGATGLNERKN